jgi:hypothetical protein
MSSLKSKSSKKQQEPVSPRLPPSLKFDSGGLGLDDLAWTKTMSSDASSRVSSEKYATTGSRYHSRANGRRSISFTSPRPPQSLPSSPQPSLHNTFGSTPDVAVNDSEQSYQAQLGNALIAASHAESAKGAHNDLLQILNHDNHPWGFSYAAYPHTVRVWYGDKDEKIAENAVRWMESNMGEERCSVKVVKGADHSLMYKSSVVVEVLETILGFWQQSSCEFYQLLCYIANRRFSVIPIIQTPLLFFHFFPLYFSKWISLHSSFCIIVSIPQSFIFYNS